MATFRFVVKVVKEHFEVVISPQTALMLEVESY